MLKSIPPAIAAIAPNGQLTVSQRRRLILDLALKRVKPGTGSALEFMQRRTAMKVWPDLRPILTNIAWAIVGAVATRAYMPERETRGLDILVHGDDGAEAIEFLKAAGYQVVSKLGIPCYLLRSPEGIEVDLIFGNYPWLEEALAQPNQDITGLPVLDLPYLVLMKSLSSRGRDIGDLNTMLGLATNEDLARVRKAVKRYAPDMVDDLETMIYLGQLEMQGFDEN